MLQTDRLLSSQGVHVGPHIVQRSPTFVEPLLCHRRADAPDFREQGRRLNEIRRAHDFGSLEIARLDDFVDVVGQFVPDALKLTGLLMNKTSRK